ncbi:acetyltransferase [Acanthopleuribacter pedis]|uniref:Acetyltransferase n=1 Tax=Acanthopleuribacter pedis TaxID=442870 RepID=A0A8J7U483_9BACT|nr:acetyltransferase [Acanthopleuribacter pedis]MBO1318006.1 acetyltransferase [Acanthopleuribacter pedis]
MVVKNVALIGWHEGLAGQVHSWLAESGPYRVTCFVHPEDSPPRVTSVARDASQFDYPTENSFKGLPLVCRADWPEVLRHDGIHHVLVTLDDALERLAALKQAQAAGLTLINAIHPSVRLMADALLGENVILHAGVHVGYRAEIRNGAFLNTNAQVDHHDVIETCATIDPGVVLAGNVTVGAGARVHTGAVVKNRIRIGAGSIIGAGAVVIRDIPAGVTAVGVPAEIIKTKAGN